MNTERTQQWAVWCPKLGEYGDEFTRLVSANSPEDAAKEYARYIDRYDHRYYIVGGVAEILLVQHASDRSNNGKIFKFRVTGEHAPRYFAKSID